MRKVFYLSIFIFSNIVTKVIEISTSKSFFKTLKKQPYVAVFFYNGQEKSHVKNIDRKINYIKLASEFPDFCYVSQIDFLMVDAKNPDLKNIPNKYSIDTKQPILVSFYKGRPLINQGEIVSLNNIDSTGSVIAFVQKHFSAYIDECLDKKFPISYQSLKWYLNSPKIKAFLDTIAYAEGTFNSQGYNICYTGKFFEDFSDHPRVINCGNIKGRTVCSSAAGRYQFLTKTWDRVAKKINARSFNPFYQDLGALVLCVQAGAFDDIKNGRFENSVDKMRFAWASFPNAPYGQQRNSITMEKLKKFYDQRLLIYGALDRNE